MLFKKVSLTAFLLAAAVPHMAFGAQIQAVATSESQDTLADAQTELAFEQLMAALESMPAEMQKLSIDDPAVVNYLHQTLNFQQDGVMPRSWIGLAKCTAYLAAFVVTTGVPVGKLVKVLKEFKAIAGSWKALARMWRVGDWGALSGESIEILKKISGIDDVIANCSNAF